MAFSTLSGTSAPPSAACRRPGERCGARMGEQAGGASGTSSAGRQQGSPFAAAARRARCLPPALPPLGAAAHLGQQLPLAILGRPSCRRPLADRRCARRGRQAQAQGQQQRAAAHGWRPRGANVWQLWFQKAACSLRPGVSGVMVHLACLPLAPPRAAGSGGRVGVRSTSAGPAGNGSRRLETGPEERRVPGASCLCRDRSRTPLSAHQARESTLVALNMQLVCKIGDCRGRAAPRGLPRWAPAAHSWHVAVAALRIGLAACARVELPTHNLCNPLGRNIRTRLPDQPVQHPPFRRIPRLSRAALAPVHRSGPLTAHAPCRLHAPAAAERRACPPAAQPRPPPPGVGAATPGGGRCGCRRRPRCAQATAAARRRQVRHPLLRR